MKQKIKSLKGKTVRLYWENNGWHHNAVGIIGEIEEVQFGFKVNGDKSISVRFETVKNVELIN